jgi:hypothetical protein
MEPSSKQPWEIIMDSPAARQSHSLLQHRLALACQRVTPTAATGCPNFSVDLFAFFSPHAGLTARLTGALASPCHGPAVLTSVLDNLCYGGSPYSAAKSAGSSQMAEDATRNMAWRKRLSRWYSLTLVLLEAIIETSRGAGCR